MSENQSMAIDLNAIVKSKAGNKKIPAFAIKLLGKILHLDLINKYLVQGYEGVEFCDKCLDYLDVKLEVEGLENIDTTPATPLPQTIPSAA